MNFNDFDCFFSFNIFFSMICLGILVSEIQKAEYCTINKQGMFQVEN